MKGLQTGLSSVQSPHDEVVVALFGSEQLHFAIDAICDSIFRAIEDLAHEEVSVKVWYFFVYVSCV